eukprot:2440583-Alexandrium_andersonii.AAC.1
MGEVRPREPVCGAALPEQPRGAARQAHRGPDHTTSCSSSGSAHARAFRGAPLGRARAPARRCTVPRSCRCR